MVKSRMIRWVGYVAYMRKRKNEYKILVANHEGKRQLGRPKHRWEGNI
jgi:hypothetical protein